MTAVDERVGRGASRAPTGFSVIDGDDRSPPARARGIVRSTVTGAVIQLIAPVFVLVCALSGSSMVREMVGTSPPWWVIVVVLFVAAGVIGGIATALYGWLYRNKRGDLALGPSVSAVVKYGAVIALVSLLSAFGVHFAEPYLTTLHLGAGEAMIALGFFCLAVLVVSYSWVRDGRGLRALGLRGAITPIFLWFLLGCAFALPVVVQTIFDDPSAADMLATSRTATIFAGLVPIILIQAGAEEIVFRGWLLTTLSARHGAFWGIVWSSLLFGMLHATPGNEVGVVSDIVPRVVIGMALCLLFLRYNSLWAPIGLHVGWNVALFTLEMGRSKDADMMSILSAQDSPTAWAALADPAYLVSYASIVVLFAVVLLATREAHVLILRGPSKPAVQA